jgi:hypothetical protein
MSHDRLKEKKIWKVVRLKALVFVGIGKKLKIALG